MNSRNVIAVAARIVPQPKTRPPIPVAALVDEKLHQGKCDGYRHAGMPREGDAWRQGLKALDAETVAASASPFDELADQDQDALLARMQKGELKDPAWETMPPDVFFKTRMARDIVLAYYAHPTAWSEIGWGGPASPRGYVRMDFNERDPWEAAEVKGRRRRSRKTEKPPCRMTPSNRPAQAMGGRPTCSVPARWVPMREYRESEAVDFVIVGTGAGGGTLACKLAEYGFSVVALDAGPYFRPLEDFASDESEQTKLYWTDDRIVDGDNPLQMGSNNSGKAVGGSTVHFAMVSLRFRPEWFKSRSLLGYGADWPLDWREMWTYYTEVEQALKISGPINYPWGPPRPRYPYRAHELNAAARALAKAAKRWASNGRKRRWRRCRRRVDWRTLASIAGFVSSGCSTNAKQSALVTWIPRAIAAGAEIRDLAMVGRVEVDSADRATGRALSSRRPMAFPARPQCRRRRLRHRDAAAAAELGNRSLSRWARQQLRPGWQESDGAIEPGGLGPHGRGGPQLQRAAVARPHRALEL